MPKNFGPLALISITLACSSAVPVQAQNLSVSPSQKMQADQQAASGVPLADLAPGAPDSYSVKAGDTLWAIAGLFLKSPWRWPELWGMNRPEIENPHRIYPGQLLVLEKNQGRAVLRTRPSATNDGPPPTVRLSPHTRYSTLADSAIPTLAPNAIEPFLAEALIVEEAGLRTAPRIVATQEGRVLLSRGDRAYARGLYADGSGQALSNAPGQPRDFRVFRNATPLKDPSTQKILAYEAQFVGKAELVRGESVVAQEPSEKSAPDVVPATLDIVATKEEIRVGDRLVPEPARELLRYVPHAPATPVSAQVVSVYGNAVALAGANQVVVINRGSQDGLERGHILAIIKDGERLTDKTDSSRTLIKLPNERNGLMMVFRTFERVSYALVLQVSDGVKVGDRLINPN